MANHHRIIQNVVHRLHQMPVGQMVQLSPSFDSVYVHRQSKNTFVIGTARTRRGLRDGYVVDLSELAFVISDIYQKLHPETGIGEKPYSLVLMDNDGFTEVLNEFDKLEQAFEYARTWAKRLADIMTGNISEYGNVIDVYESNNRIYARLFVEPTN